MQVDVLYREFYKVADVNDPEKLLPWIQEKLDNNADDIDCRYLYLEILRWNNLDVEDDKEEFEVLKLCSAIIRDSTEENSIRKAKAHAYRGEIRHFGIDRRRDFDKAKTILLHFSTENGEVKFLTEFISILYNQDFRQYLPIYQNYLNLLIL